MPSHQLWEQCVAVKQRFVAKDDLVLFRCSPVFSCTAPLQTEASREAHVGRRDPKCPSARRIRMVQEDTGGPSEGAAYAWMATKEAVGCMHAFIMMWWSSRRLVCPELGLRINDISLIHLSQHLLTTQSERPN
ncbi:uncharacterized protein TNCV_1730581 [Trichonephila clavipes]|nr:uncharacterized protein TNCV_1730581 [Trichonephila clavipes]